MASTVVDPLHVAPILDGRPKGADLQLYSAVRSYAEHFPDHHPVSQAHIALLSDCGLGYIAMKPHTNDNTPYDVHEVADQSRKAGTPNSNGSHGVSCTFSLSGTCFTDRKLAAVHTYHEWMPVR